MNGFRRFRQCPLVGMLPSTRLFDQVLIDCLMSPLLGVDIPTERDCHNRRKPRGATNERERSLIYPCRLAKYWQPLRFSVAAYPLVARGTVDYAFVSSKGASARAGAPSVACALGHRRRRNATLLDGRNRWRACEIAGVEPKLRDWNGDDPIAYVVSMNLRRRHMDESQRAMVAARIATMKQGARTDITAIAAKSQDDASRLLNVSVDNIQRAKKVIDKGEPQLAAAVERGENAVSTAASIAEMKHEMAGTP